MRKKQHGAGNVSAFPSHVPTCLPGDGLQSKYKNMMDDAARQAAMEIAAAVVASAEELGHGDLEDSDEEDEEEEESELRHIDDEDEEDDDDAMEQLEFDDEDEDED